MPSFAANLELLFREQTTSLPDARKRRSPGLANVAPEGGVNRLVVLRGQGCAARRQDTSRPGSSMRSRWRFGTSAPDQEVKVGATVRLHYVFHIQLCIATAGRTALWAHVCTAME